MIYQNTQNRSGLMNLIAEFIVKMLSEDNKSKINVSITDHKKFLVINGQTNSSKILDLDKLRTDFTLKMSESTSMFDISKLNFIDLVDYKSTDHMICPKNMNFVFYNSELPRIDQQIIDKVKELENLDYSEISISEIGTHILTPPLNSYEKQYQSSFPYGYSLYDWKWIYYYFEYISLNVFPNIKGNYLKINVDSDLNFSVSSDSLFSDHDIESMIKDVFNFDKNGFVSELKDYDMTKDCLLFIDRPWLKKDKVKDCIIF